MPGSMDTLVEHADRLWSSERENAARIESRIQLVAGGSVALLGLGCFSFEWQYSAPSNPACPAAIVLIVHVLLAAAILFFATSLARIYSDSGSKLLPTATSTELMEFSASDAGKPIDTLVFSKTYRAYLDLKKRNEGQRLLLAKGQQWFGIGLIAIFLAILIYLFGSMPTKMKAVSQYGSGNPTASRAEAHPA